METIDYDRLIEIIHQQNKTDVDVAKAINKLADLDTKDLLKKDFKDIEGFIVNTASIEMSKEKYDSLTKIIDFVRGE